MGALVSKPPTADDEGFRCCCEAFRRKRNDVAAELAFRYFVKPLLTKLEIELFTRVSRGDTLFKLLIVENTTKSKVCYDAIVLNHEGVFDRTMLSHVKLALPLHELALRISVDKERVEIIGTVLTKM